MRSMAFLRAVLLMRRQSMCGESARLVAICCRPAPRGSTAARRRRGHGRLASFRVPSAPFLCSSLPPFFSVPMCLFLSYMPPVCHVFKYASIPLILDTLWHE